MVYYDRLMTLSQPEMHDLFRRLHFGFVYHTIFAICISLILWEYFLNIDAEIRTWKLLIEGHILPARLAVLVVRYSSLCSCLFAALFLWGHLEDCQSLFYAHYALYCLVWASSASIFLMRLQILFLNQRTVSICYFALYLFCLGSWIFTVTQIKSAPTDQSFRMPYVPTCVPDRFPQLGVIAWSASVLFDFCVFLGTFIRYRSTFRRRSTKATRTTSQAPSRKWSFQANFYYFGTSLAFNVTCLVSALVVNDPVLSHVGAVIAMTHMSIIATRLVFSAKGWAKRLGKEDDLVADTAIKLAGENNGKDAIRYTVKETIVFDPQCDDEIELGGSTSKEHYPFPSTRSSADTHHDSQEIETENLR